MAVKAAVVTGTLPTSNGSYTDFTVADFGTVDAAIIIASNTNTGSNPQTNATFNVGFWTSSSQCCTTCSSQDNKSVATEGGRYASTSDVIRQYDVVSGTPDTYTLLTECSAASTTNGIRITKDSGSSSAARYTTVLLLNGLTNEYVGSVNIGTGTSAINVTDPGFRADLVFAVSVGGTASDSTIATAILSFGAAQIAANDTVSQGCLLYGSDDEAADSNAASMLRNDAVAGQLLPGANAWNAGVGAHASGFTITPTASSGSDIVYYLAIELPDPEDAYVATKDVATGSGGAAYTGAGFTPQAVILAATMATAVNTETAGGAWAIGAGGPATTEQCIGFCDEDAQATSNTESYANTSSILYLKTQAGADEAVAALDSLDSDGWTLAYSDYAASARKMLAIAIGNSTGGPYTLTAGAGTFTLSGIATGLTAQRKLTADAVTLALTGNDAALSGQHKLTAASASFALTGNAATLGSQKSIAVDVGEFTLTGVDSGLTVTRNLTAEPGIFGLLGKDAELTYGSTGAYTMPASTGNFALTGKDIITKAARKMPATVVSFTATGVAAGLLFGRKLIATAQSYGLQYNPATFLYKRKFSVSSAAFVLDRLEAGLLWSGSGGYTLTATTRAFALTGLAASLRIARYMDALPRPFYLTGYDTKYGTTSGDWTHVASSSSLWSDVSDSTNTWVDVP